MQVEFHSLRNPLSYIPPGLSVLIVTWPTSHVTVLYIVFRAAFMQDDVCCNECDGCVLFFSFPLQFKRFHKEIITELEKKTEMDVKYMTVSVATYLCISAGIHNTMLLFNANIYPGGKAAELS